MNMIKIRVIMKYEFRCGSNAALTAHNANDVSGVNTANEYTPRYCFGPFQNHSMFWTIPICS